MVAQIYYLQTQIVAIDLKKINQGIADRSNVFYWQTDRKVTPEEAGEIWADRHRYFSDEDLKSTINKYLPAGDELVFLELLDLNGQANLGNVNSVRVGRLSSGKEVVIRNHPRGIINGYFYAESLAAKKVKEAGLPCYDTIAVHEMENEEDHSFQVIEKLPGQAIVRWLEDKENKKKEKEMLFEIGKTLAKVNKLEVEGFGPFDNEKAKQGILQGIHSSFENAINAGLEFNLDCLQQEGIFTETQTKEIKKLFSGNPLLQIEKSFLVHNDFADWNLLTDGEKVSGILDFDECVGGDPISEIACWSTFFDPGRLPLMLEGYWSEAEKPDNFEERFELSRFRHTMSKMTLRVRRYNWDPNEYVRNKIKTGREELKKSLAYFKI